MLSCHSPSSSSRKASKGGSARVDLVDQQQRAGALLERLQQRPWRQELAAEQARGECLALLGRRGLQRHELARVLPVVGRLRQFDALEALQPDQLPAQRLRQRLGECRLAAARRALEQQRLGELQRQPGGGGQRLVGQVVRLMQRSGQLLW
jgi:hypothetical protein